jgi:Fe-S-cluster formation regulator IscX/YfhJ
MKESVINKYETDIGLLKNDVHSKQIEINDINSKLNTIIKTNDNLYQDNLALKNESVKYQTFISTYITKIINTLVNITHIQPKQIINNENDSDTIDNNTLPFINLDNYLSQLQIQFDSETNTSKNKIETLEQEISKLEDENKQMKSQMNIDKLYQDKIDLNMKLQEISEVLKESNKLLDECNKENTHLKDKIISLEHDKQRLTQENEELRETISYYTNQNYKEQLADIKQQLKQTQHDNEFLCIQNKTLETLVKQLKNKTHTNKNKQQQQIHQKHNTFQNEIFTFGRDDYLKEKELNDILNKYSYDIYLNQMNQNHLISNNSFESLKLNPSSSQMFHSPIDDTI